jgi:hypothetical protein
VANAPTEIGYSSKEYPVGQESATYRIDLPVGTQPGDVFLVEVICAVIDVPLTGTPGADNNIIISDAQPGSANVRGSVHVYTVPAVVPTFIEYTWASAVRGNIGWVHLRGEGGGIILEDDKSSGWTATSTNEVQVDDLVTTNPNALIYGGVQVGSGSTTAAVQGGGWTTLISATQRKGFIARKGVQTLPGTSGIPTFTSTSTNNLRGWQVAFTSTGGGGTGPTPGAITGASASGLLSPAGRWLKPVTRLIWEHDSKWFSIIPTPTGHRFIELREGGDHVIGSVVESVQSRRVTSVYRNGVVYVLSFGSDGSMKFGSFNATTFAPIIAMGTPSQFTITIPNTDETPPSLSISASGYLWIGLYTGGAQRYLRSTDGGATWVTNASTAGLGGTLRGMLDYMPRDNNMVSFLTSNDGLGPRQSRTYAEDYNGTPAGGTSVTLSSLPAGATADDHLATTVLPDGTLIVVSKTTNGDVDGVVLIYMMTLPPGATTWTAPVAIETGPDGPGPSGTAAGYTRPSVTVAFDRLMVFYGSIYEPNVISMKWAPLSDLTTWSARDTVLDSGTFTDGAQVPDAADVRRSDVAKFPILAHDADTGQIIASWFDTRNPTPAPTFTDVIVAAPLSTGFTVCATATGPISGAKLVVATNAGLTAGVVTTTAAIPDSIGRVQVPVAGLAEFTDYHYGLIPIGTDGYEYPVQYVGQTNTIPGENFVGTYSWGMGSCFDSLDTELTTPSSGSFGRMLAHNPAFWFYLGDKTYANNSSTQQSSHYNDLKQTLTYSSALRELHKSIPVIPLNSDHDGGGANNSFPGVYTPANRAANLQMYAFLTRPDPNMLYHSFKIGSVRYIVTDTRYAAEVGVTRMGATQKAWFKAELQQPEPVKVWIQESIWIDNEPNSGEDKWQDFPAEKSELGTFIANEAVGQVVTATGDQHSLGADDGSNNPWGGFPSFCAAPFRNTSSIKTLSVDDWSEGMYPTTQGVEVAQHGITTVTETADSVTLAFRGYDTTNTIRVQLDVVVPINQEPETGVVIRMKSGGIVTERRIKKVKVGAEIRPVVAGWVKQGGILLPLLGSEPPAEAAMWSFIADEDPDVAVDTVKARPMLLSNVSRVSTPGGGGVQGLAGGGVGDVGIGYAPTLASAFTLFANVMLPEGVSTNINYVSLFSDGLPEYVARMYVRGNLLATQPYVTCRFEGVFGGASKNVFQQVSRNTPGKVWYKIAATFDGSMLRLYRDGASIGTPAATTGIIPIADRIKLDVAEGCIVDEVQIFRKALTPEELAAL